MVKNQSLKWKESFHWSDLNSHFSAFQPRPIYLLSIQPFIHPTQYFSLKCMSAQAVWFPGILQGLHRGEGVVWFRYVLRYILWISYFVCLLLVAPVFSPLLFYSNQQGISHPPSALFCSRLPVLKGGFVEPTMCKLLTLFSLWFATIEIHWTEGF